MTFRERLVTQLLLMVARILCEDLRLATWIAAKMGLVARDIQNLRIEANPSREWSDITFEGFDATVRFTYRGEQKWYSMDEAEVCQFLNSLAGGSEEGGEK